MTHDFKGVSSHEFHLKSVTLAKMVTVPKLSNTTQIFWSNIFFPISVSWMNSNTIYDRLVHNK